MGIFSKTCEYAIRAVFYIAMRSEEGYKSGVKEIAENINSPEAFLAKLLQKLCKAGIISSTKGPNGGFYMDTPSLKRPIADIVLAIEGNDIFVGCAMGLRQCSEKNPCPLHYEFKKIRNQISNLLFQTAIGKFNDELIKKELQLKR